MISYKTDLQMVTVYFKFPSKFKNTIGGIYCSPGNMFFIMKVVSDLNLWMVQAIKEWKNIHRYDKHSESLSTDDTNANNFKVDNKERFFKSVEEKSVLRQRLNISDTSFL